MTSGMEYWVNRLENAEMLPENHKVIKDHIRRIKAKGMAEHTILNHLETLTQFGKWCYKTFADLTEDDLLDYSDYLDKYKHGTKYTKLATVKAFLKNVNPIASQSVKIKMQHTRKLPEDLLTPDDIENMISNCSNPRDRALIATLYESGMRKGELFSIKIKNVVFDENGVTITIPQGKTGSRRIRLVYSASFLRSWLDVHPTKELRESPLFVSFREPFPVLSNSGLTDQLTKIGKKAGIQKPINPHSFRHAAATHLAEHLTEQQLKSYLGWTAGSNMAAVYVHLSGKNMDNAILRMNGIEVNEKDNNSLKVMKCPRCKELNPETADYCFKCNLPLKEPLKFENELEELRAKVEAIEKDRKQMLQNIEEVHKQLGKT